MLACSPPQYLWLLPSLFNGSGSSARAAAVAYGPRFIFFLLVVLKVRIRHVNHAVASRLPDTLPVFCLLEVKRALVTVSCLSQSTFILSFRETVFFFFSFLLLFLLRSSSENLRTRELPTRTDSQSNVNLHRSTVNGHRVLGITTHISSGSMCEHVLFILASFALF